MENQAAIMRQTYNAGIYQTAEHSLVSRISTLLVIFLLAGCGPTSRQIEYQNKETGIWFEMPGNWTAEYYDRNAMVYVSGRRATVPDAVAYITISAGHCSNQLDSVDTELEALTVMVKNDIERMGRLYGLETVEILEEPTRVEGKYSEGIRAVVQIPTAAMGEDPKEVPAGNPASVAFQIIEVYAINYNQNILWIHFYPGSDERLNDQAREIIRSMRRVCGPQGK